MHPAIHGPKRTSDSHRGERSSQFFHGDKKAFDAAEKASLVAAFYAQIRRHGQERIEQEMREDAEEEVFWRG